MGKSPTTIVVVGTGIASSLLLAGLLEDRRRKIRVIVLERGRQESLSWKLANRHNVQPHGVVSELRYRDTFENLSPRKEWVFNLGFGGGSNVWWGCTPRFLPKDFKTHSHYGVGLDWPLSYGDLEPFYSKAEELMQIAGPSEHTPFKRSRPYPLPAHRLSSVDEALLKAHPDHFFALPTARASRSTPHRAACCASGVCFLCPVGAKFTVEQEMAALYQDPRVELLTGAEVSHLEINNADVTSAFVSIAGRDRRIQGDLYCLGANPIFNSAILLKSGFTHAALGRGIAEQRSIFFRARLRSLRGFDGGTSITGHHYGWYDSAARSHAAGCLIETWNVPRIALIGDPRSAFEFKAIFEDLPHSDSRVTLSAQGKPQVSYHGTTAYLRKGVEHFFATLSPLQETLGIEELLPATPEQALNALSRTEGHIIGGHAMGSNPAVSVVDKYLRYHNSQNLYLLGAGVFPTISPANPSLTVAALSLHCADHLAALL
ncbi:MAG: GMC family oxidoreductase [Bdellovibrionota bacterium]|nr:MAG: GMC family oxidoreductase [Bdellovibrionota bacterium]